MHLNTSGAGHGACYDIRFGSACSLLSRCAAGPFTLVSRRGPVESAAWVLVGLVQNPPSRYVLTTKQIKDRSGVHCPRHVAACEGKEMAFLDELVVAPGGGRCTRKTRMGTCWIGVEREIGDETTGESAGTAWARHCYGGAMELCAHACLVLLGRRLLVGE